MIEMILDDSYFCYGKEKLVVISMVRGEEGFGVMNWIYYKLFLWSWLFFIGEVLGYRRKVRIYFGIIIMELMIESIVWY